MNLMQFNLNIQDGLILFLSALVLSDGIHSFHCQSIHESSAQRHCVHFCTDTEDDAFS